MQLLFYFDNNASDEAGFDPKLIDVQYLSDLSFEICQLVRYSVVSKIFLKYNNCTFLCPR
jgi:hypothetical protein